jgi:hypothetical protein
MITPTTYRGYRLVPTADHRVLIQFQGEDIVTELTFDDACALVDLWVDNQHDS